MDTGVPHTANYMCKMKQMNTGVVHNVDGWYEWHAHTMQFTMLIFFFFFNHAYFFFLSKICEEF